MLTKFESKSNRVKGLSFHPIRPWILTSLHNGILQLWDYRMGTLLDRFDEHDGPVRGVDFHKVQPLIVSGGDDYKIKVWDHKLRRCLFTLLGHLDYIRTVEFHEEYPWIVSASDDQTIRIWNWQSRTCVAVLTGHNHYVMCASFHPKEDLIVSASLDQTVRVWDMTGLRKKTVRGAPSSVNEDALSRVNADLFGGTDAVVKYVLEGHDRGVNWASFHPTLPLVVSGADDRQVKLWRMNETKAWEVHTMTGHTNNVSCAIFHPKRELIVSNSEDRSIRVWDISQRMGVQTFRRENDRFWIMAAHPQQNLLAAGHDSGMIVFKLERERPAFCSDANHLFYVKDRYLRVHEFQSGRDVPVLSLRRGSGQSSSSGLGQSPRSLAINPFNPAEHNVLVFSDAEGGTYELMSFPLESLGGGGGGDPGDVRRGPALDAVFMARNRFAVLDKSRQIIIKNFHNEVTKKLSPPHPSTDGMFFGGTAGRVLLKCEDRVSLFDVQSRRVVGEVQAPRVKYVYWNRDCSFVALVGKHSIVLATKTMGQLCSITETVRVKSGAWDETMRAFVYSTLNHIKYVLPNGDVGIIRTLDVPIYIARTVGSQLLCLDREVKTRVIGIDSTEAAFKLALEDKRYGEVMHMVRHSRLCGNAIISYLQEKGFPEVALHFVNDAKTRFRLALACGNIEVAMHTAYDLTDDKVWCELAQEALRQGNHEVVEMSYQRIKNFDGLSFLYMLMGNSDKLRKMLKIAERRGDVMSRFHNALYLGDARERVAVLESTGQISLAYVTAATHGLEEDAERLKSLIEGQDLPVPKLPSQEEATLLLPPTPITRCENWPLLALSKSAIEGATATEPTTAALPTYEEPPGAAWEDDLDLGEDPAASRSQILNSSGHVDESFGGGGGWGDDLDLGDDLGLDDSHQIGTADWPAADPSAAFADTAPGTARDHYWRQNSSHAADHIAAGDIEGAMNLLNRQIAVVNFAPMESHFIALSTGAVASLPGLVQTPSIRSLLQRNDSAAAQDKEGLPMLCLKLPPLIERLTIAYKAFHAGKFTEAKDHFTYILQTIPLVVVDIKSDGIELKELLEICREYITAIRLKNAVAETEDPVRGMELALYFTHCNMQPAHLLLALRMAMASAFKNKVWL
jgi:coatomer protein complex subunit alpha (xenin)